MPIAKEFRVIKRTKLLTDATPNAAAILQLEIGDRLNATGSTMGDFDQVVFISGDGEEHKGWVLQRDRALADTRPRPDFDVEGFVEICIVAQRAMNAETSAAAVAADLVIARAILETKLKNLGPVTEGSDAVGPLQVSSAEWKHFLEMGKPYSEGFTQHLRDDPMQQIWGAAFRGRTDAAAVAQLRLQKGSGKKEDPPLPSYLEVFLTYLANSAEAAIALVDAAEDTAGKAKSLTSFLKASIGAINDHQIDALRVAVERMTGKPAPTKVGDFVAAVATALNAALQETFEHIKKFTPAELMPVGGKAPWFAIAKAENAKNIVEPNDRILEYFKEIDFKTDTTDTPWCAAFVGFCMKTSGDPKVEASVPKAPARAASWRNWGQPLALNGSTPEGAVVVLRPTEKNDSSGHVGFFVRGDAQSVTLLGGNQSNRVKESTYSRGRIASIQWLEGSGGPAPAGAHGNIKLDKIAQGSRRQMAELIISRFASAGFGVLQQVAAVANAIAESGLNPNARASTAVEDSVGLFQLNRTGGLGTGFSVEQLQNPETNIAIIISAAKKTDFGQAKSLEEAVSIFVRKVERPANQAQEIVKRLATANSLMV